MRYVALGRNSLLGASGYLGKSEQTVRLHPAFSRALADWWRKLPKCFDHAAGVDLPEWSVEQLDQFRMVYNQICDRVSQGSDSVDVGELVEETREELFVVMSVRRLRQIDMGTVVACYIPSNLRNMRHAAVTSAIKRLALVT
jgi:hypothetical protein